MGIFLQLVNASKNKISSYIYHMSIFVSHRTSMWLGAGRSGDWIPVGRGRDFPLPSCRALGPTQPPAQWVPFLFPGGKVAGAWHWPVTPSSADVKVKVGLYLYLPSLAFIVCSRVNFTFTFTFTFITLQW